MNNLTPTPGDIYRVQRLTLPHGIVRPDHGQDLIVLFLGACDHVVDPDVVAWLGGMGFARTHVFEVTLEGAERDFVELFTASMPTEAALAAIRMAAAWTEPIQGLSLRLRRLGPVSPEGKPWQGDGPVFLRWSLATGVTLDQLAERVRKCSLDGTSST